MVAPLNISGQRFNALIAIERAGSDKHGKALWRFKCECGAEPALVASRVVQGKTTSCGCRQHAMAAANAQAGAAKIAASKTKHGGHGTAEYFVWKTMRQRCFNPNSKDYPSYGGAGIAVCERWADFAAFIADMGQRPSNGHSLDRIDNARGYSPDNCRWATAHVQKVNQRRMVQWQSL